LKASTLARKPKADAIGAAVVLTIGHSTHPLDEFLGLLRAHGVTRVVDVRTVPRSLHNPQFNKTSLSKSLSSAALSYVHMPGLGGLRRARPDSVNMGWRNPSFRGYADYMQTPQFAQSLGELIRLAGEDRIALMCAEAVPWRCHRSLIADALLVRGIRTEDIMTLTRRPVHTLTLFAQVHGTRLTYPAAPSTDTPVASKRKRLRSASATLKRAPQRNGASDTPPAAPAARARGRRAGVGGR
jgi:hypothetical protein